MDALSELLDSLNKKRKGIRVDLTGNRMEAIITMVIDGKDTVCVYHTRGELDSLINILTAARKMMI